MAMSIRTITTTTALTRSNSRSSLLHPHLRLNQKDSCHFLGNRSLRSCSSTSLQRVQIGSKILLMVVNSVDPGSPPLPSDPSGGSWKMWLLGVLFSVIIPFTKNKWYPLLKLKEQVETALDAAEEVAELVEKVSDKVEEVADEIGNHLPEGKLRHAAMLVEELADKTGKAAALADDIIEKTEEVEREVDSIIEKANELKKEDKIKEASTKQAADTTENETVAN
ncbi:PREDICTED: uncharacterized protein LOC101306919 [Fragaria vesca subsp. vesca]|uniref:uncharacterized protein LOC101306919 n=1 Tax=Fragaria vesca subsp. vesca TaxID=101020 RepID=UPI0002C35F3E|nr:PREDICTED: uncharacterized protein LOC101306919 [Fragaria vesca subsp. vesca]